MAVQFRVRQKGPFCDLHKLPFSLPPEGVLLFQDAEDWVQKPNACLWGLLIFHSLLFLRTPTDLSSGPLTQGLGNGCTIYSANAHRAPTVDLALSWALSSEEAREKLDSRPEKLTV